MAEADLSALQAELVALRKSYITLTRNYVRATVGEIFGDLASISEDEDGMVIVAPVGKSEEALMLTQWLAILPKSGFLVVTGRTHERFMLTISFVATVVA